MDWDSAGPRPQGAAWRRLPLSCSLYLAFAEGPLYGQQPAQSSLGHDHDGVRSEQGPKSSCKAGSLGHRGMCGVWRGAVKSRLLSTDHAGDIGIQMARSQGQMKQQVVGKSDWKGQVSVHHPIRQGVLESLSPAGRRLCSQDPWEECLRPDIFCDRAKDRMRRVRSKDVNSKEASLPGPACPCMALRPGRGVSFNSAPCHLPHLPSTLALQVVPLLTQTAAPLVPQNSTDGLSSQILGVIGVSTWV